MDTGHCAHSYGPTCEPSPSPPRATWVGFQPKRPPVRKSPSVILSQFDRLMDSSLDYVRITQRNLSLPWFADETLRQLAQSTSWPLPSVDRPSRPSPTAAPELISEQFRACSTRHDEIPPVPRLYPPHGPSAAPSTVPSLLPPASSPGRFI